MAAMFLRRPKKPTKRLVPRRPTQRYRYVRLRWHLVFGLFDFVGGTIFGLAKIVRRMLNFCRPSPGPADDPRSILVLQLDHMGDAILSTGMLHSLRTSYPSARIDILVGPWNRALFEETVADVDRVIVFESGGRLARLGKLRWMSVIAKMAWPVAMLRYGWKLRRERYDLGIDVRGEMPHAALMWVAGIRRRVGWVAGGGGFLLTDSPRWVPDRPEIESRRSILETLGLSVDRSAMLPRLTVPSNLTAEQILGESYKYIVIHLTAGTRAKEWPVEHWARLIANLLDNPPRSLPSPKIVLVGIAADHIIGENVEKLVAGPARVASPARVENWIGRLSLVELAAVLDRATLMIGADSGPAHMAAAVGTPTVVLFSGTNCQAQWRPPGEHVTVLAHDVPCRPCHQKKACPIAAHPCMTGITPEQVAEAVRKRTEDREQRTEGATAPR